MVLDRRLGKLFPNYRLEAAKWGHNRPRF